MLQHVALETSPADGERARRFWQLLGFREVDPPESLRDRAAWMERSGTQIHLLWSGSPIAPAEGHAAVTVDGYEEAVEALRADGFEVEARTEHWGARRSFARAPGGHRVELMSAPPA